MEITTSNLNADWIEALLREWQKQRDEETSGSPPLAQRPCRSGPTVDEQSQPEPEAAKAPCAHIEMVVLDGAALPCRTPIRTPRRNGSGSGRR